MYFEIDRESNIRAGRGPVSVLRDFLEWSEL